MKDCKVGPSRWTEEELVLWEGPAALVIEWMRPKERGAADSGAWLWGLDGKGAIFHSGNHVLVGAS